MRTSRKWWLVLGPVALAAALGLGPAVAGAQALTPAQQLGKQLFFDESLSINGNQACAACHAPASGWTGPDASINAHGAVYEGSVPGRFGNRKPPSSAYATPSPILHLERGMFVGGNFWDGRATGLRLGSPSAEQALGPFLNPLEQALPSPADVVGLVCTGGYSALFLQVCGAAACDPASVQAAYDCVGLSIAAYEGSPEVNQFSSKYDAVVAGTARLTREEQQGLAVFMGKGKCSRCHVATPRGRPALFTDYTYDNLGVPRNPENPFYDEPAFNPAGLGWLDLGLGGFLATQGDPQWAALAAASYGKHKVPTLRNVDAWDPALGPRVKAYSHNGWFKSLESIVHFYNTRDVLPMCPGGSYTEAQALAAGCWPPPEIPRNVNTKELGNLGLSAAEEAALVAFMRTLTDGFVP
jgi:cytochrome c peroxidase